MTTTTETAFKVGRTYWARSICDHECIFRFEVVGRTEKTVSIKSKAVPAKGVTRRKIRLYDGVEHIDPLGRYSMSPVLRADRMSD